MLHIRTFFSLNLSWTQGRAFHVYDQSSRCKLATSRTMYVQYARKTDFLFEIWDPCEYFLSANNAGLSSTVWKTNRGLENTLSGYNSTETVS